MAFAHVVTVPVRNQNRHVALHHRLASKARCQLIIGGLLHAIHLVVFHFGQIGGALFDNDVTSGAGAAAAAGMLQMKVEIHRHIQQRSGTPVFLVRQFSLLELKRFIGGQEGYFRHNPIVAGRQVRRRR